MEGTFKVTTQPVTEPVTVAEVKAALNIDFSDDDALIEDFITAAREYYEANTNLALLTQTVTQVVEGFPRPRVNNPLGLIRLFKYPIQSLSSVTYYDEDDNVQTLTVGGGTPEVELDSYAMPSTIFLNTKNLSAWPATRTDRPNAVTLVYTCGYTSAALVPQAVKNAIKLLVGEMYEKRENFVREKLTAADHLMRLQEIRLY
jgi:uncharacterized phiE125 gp8 family phage protein